MIPKLLLTVGISLFTLCNLYAQHAIIKGQIKNDTGNPLAGTTIFLHILTDSSITKIAVTDKTGDYELTYIPANNYFISTDFIGFDKASTSAFTVTDNEKIITPVIFLKIASQKMKAVMVTGTREKPLIEVTADKTIFHVENSINAVGSSAFELLQKSPGVSTDKDDNVSMKGKNGVRIYIDGRPTQLEAAELAAYLRSINSASIESIEMISNPAAKYEAAGNAGIINIRLKKNNTIGLSAAITAGLTIAKHPKTADGFSLNYRNKTINLFSNYNYAFGRNDNTGSLYRVQNDSVYNQTNYGNITGHAQNIKVGADFFVSTKSTFGIIYTGNFSNNTTYSFSRTPSSANKTGIVQQVLYASNTLPAQIKNQNFNTNYRYVDASGQELNIDIDHGSYNRSKTSYQPNSYYSAAPEKLIDEKDFRNNTPTNIIINTQKIDYVTPFKKGKISVGIKISHVKTDNNFTLYNVVSGQNEIDLNSSNIFLYKENINAGYASYFTTLSKKINLQAGLRVENTTSRGLLTSMASMQNPGDEAVDRKYTDFFPSAAFTYMLNKENLLNLNYSRRIDRPNYSDLNPFETRIDELTYIKGNAYLRPQYSNIIQLTHSFKERYFTSLSYSHVRDFSAYITDTAKTNQTYISKKNLASQDVASLNFYIPITITKYWKFNTSINLFNSSYHANFEPGKLININVTSYSFNATNDFKLGNGFTAEITGFYNGPSVAAGTFKTNGSGSMDMGIQKKFYHENATIKIAYTDVFHTLKWRGESNYGGTTIIATSQWESRQLRINFDYNFGHTKVKQARLHNGGNEDEKQRIITGDGAAN